MALDDLGGSFARLTIRTSALPGRCSRNDSMSICRRREILVANIQKRPNGTWRARYRDSAEKEHARHFARKVDAQAWLDGVTTAVNTGAYVDPSRSRMTVGALAEQWIVGKVNLKPSTHALYGSILITHVLPRWRDSPLPRTEHGDIQAWIADLVASGLSPSHVRDVHGVLSGILGLAVRDRRLPANPADGVDLPRLVKRKRRYLTADQVERLADVAGPDGRLVILVLSYCGLRWCELAALRGGSVDFLRRRLVVSEAMIEVHGRLVWGTPKSHEARSVPVPRVLIDELAAHVAGKSRDDLVFTTGRGAPLRNRNARRSWFDAAATAIGEPSLTPHELRHTAASLAVSSGANVKAVQAMLGHASAAMTLDTYADLFDDDLDAVADRLDAVVRKARGLLADSLRTGTEIVTLPTAGQMPTSQ
jgi:integrase